MRSHRNGYFLSLPYVSEGSPTFSDCFPGVDFGWAFAGHPPLLFLLLRIYNLKIRWDHIKLDFPWHSQTFLKRIRRYLIFFAIFAIFCNFKGFFLGVHFWKLTWRSTFWQTWSHTYKRTSESLGLDRGPLMIHLTKAFYVPICGGRA